MNKILGKKGEEIACNYLKDKSFRIIERNFTIWGGEIDIIAQKGYIYHFVEVKTRRDPIISIESQISNKKINTLIRSSEFWLNKNNLNKVFWQIDFIGIIIGHNNKVEDINFIENISLVY